MNVRSSSTKDKKKMLMRGFMCQSPAETAVSVCSADARSVIVPRRSASHAQYMMRRSSSADHTRLLRDNNNAGQYYHSSFLRSTNTPQGQVQRVSRFNSNHEAATHDEKRSLSLVTRPSFIYNEVPDGDLTLSHQRTRSKPKTSQLIQKPLSSQSAIPSSADNVFQVVVMRVSLHCQGCAGKVEKHLSKMEGVTSFSIDLETKTVTVRGHVSPVGVVESVSKVKKAELLVY